MSGEGDRDDTGRSASLRRQVLPSELASPIIASRQIPPIVFDGPGPSSSISTLSGPVSALNRTRRLGGYETPPIAASGSNRVPVLTRRRTVRSSKGDRDLDDDDVAMSGSNVYTTPFDVPAYISSINQLSSQFFTTPAASSSTAHAHVAAESSASSSSHARPATTSTKKYWLPTCWDLHDKSVLLDLSSDCLSASFGGSAKYGDNDAAAVRSNRSIPPQCSVYYFEVTVVDKGQAGYIGIGLSGPNVSLSRLPGWEKESWAFHGDDGSIFSGRGQGTPFGPTYGTGDVIGVGVDWTHAHSLHPGHYEGAKKPGPLAKIFFTKNGQLLGGTNSSNGSHYAFTNVACTALYPTVGLRTPGEKIKVNFGAEPFAFNIESYVRQRRLATLLEFKALPPVKDSIVHDIILSYLLHNGYARTATAFAKSTKLPLSDMSAVERRGRIRQAIVEGRMQDAQSDLEHVAGVDATDNAPSSSPLPLLRMRAWVELYWRRLENKRRTPPPPSAAYKGKGKASAPSEPSAMSMNVDEEDEHGSTDEGAFELDPDEEAILALGAELNEAYASTHPDEITSTFSLLAYDNVDQMPPQVKSLLSQSARDALADRVNQYLLKAEGSPTVPALELVWRYAESQRQWASEMGTRAALVGLRDALDP